jgi:hypothetical protein
VTLEVDGLKKACFKEGNRSTLYKSILGDSHEFLSQDSLELCG